MTDLISSLADAIVALINAKPQSPTKADISAALLAVMQKTNTITRDALGNIYYGGICSGWGSVSCDIIKIIEDGIVERRTPSATRLTDKQRLDLLEECLAVLKQTQPELFGERQWGMGCLPEPQPAPLMPLPYKEPSTALMQLMEAVRSDTAPYAWTPCPGSTNGAHAWTYHVNNDECRCPCGARVEGYKP